MYKHFVAVAAACVLLVPAASAQEAFPSRPFRVVVPVPAGGNLDLVTRAVSERLAQVTGQPVVVENRSGASSTVGTRFVAQSKPDGYTILAMANTFLSTPSVMANAGYDPVGDFTGVTELARIPNVLVVPAASPYKTVLELIAAAKAKPGQMSYASAGGGSVAHMGTERFSRQVDIKLVHIPYKGNAPALVDVVGGRVDFMFDQVSTSSPHLKAGKLRALGVTTKQRSALHPEIPTLIEAGVDFEDVTFNGFSVPSGTPRDIVQKLYADLARALSSPDLKVRFVGQGIEIAPSASPEQFQQFMKDEVARYQKLTREANIKLD